jgi:hypothetical protein
MLRYFLATTVILAALLAHVQPVTPIYQVETPVPTLPFVWTPAPTTPGPDQGPPPTLPIVATPLPVTPSPGPCDLCDPPIRGWIYLPFVRR